MAVQIIDGKVYIAPNMFLTNPKTGKPLTEEEYVGLRKR